MTDPRRDQTHGVFGISVAAELLGMGVQNLRLYEARGLVSPVRTAGGTRRYSHDDLDRLRRIGDLLEAGLNLAGIGMVLELEHENARLKRENARRRGGQEVRAWPAVVTTTSSRRSPKQSREDGDDQQGPRRRR